jgi:protein-tyrosine phosphatase
VAEFYIFVNKYRMHSPPKILMVCLGNICRSPMAEGILRYQLKEQGYLTHIDSAGTGGWHAGEHPDTRAIQAMNHHGIDISNLVARQFIKNDFDQFDLILAMDTTNYKDIIRLSPDQTSTQKVQLILSYIPGAKDLSVPDPWYGNQDGFEKVYQLLNQACREVIKTHFV